MTVFSIHHYGGLPQDDLSCLSLRMWNPHGHKRLFSDYVWTALHRVVFPRLCVCDFFFAMLISFVSVYNQTVD